MKTIITYLALTVAIFAEPADLTNIRKSYQKEQEILKLKYVNWLEKRIRESSGDEKDSYEKELESLTGETREKDLVIVSNYVDGRTINVDARKGNYRIGNLKAGDKIRLQYDSGIWSAYPDWPKESPENPRVSRHRLYFVVKDGDVEAVNEALIDTAKKPFEHVMAKDGEVYLFMGGVEILNDNSGTVKYRMEIIKSDKN